jgi:hypothetical protein
MRKYDSQTHNTGEVAVLSAQQHGTLASRLKSWNSQLERYKLIQQAIQEAQADEASLTAAHNALEARANAAVAANGANAGSCGQARQP